MSGGWMNERVDGWMVGVKAGLRIAYIDQKCFMKMPSKTSF